MPDANHYIAHAEDALLKQVTQRRRAYGPASAEYTMGEIDLALRIANARSLALIAHHLSPQIQVMEAPPDVEQFGMAVCVLKGQHDEWQAHTLLECPTYRAPEEPPAADPWTKAVPINDAD